MGKWINWLQVPPWLLVVINLICVFLVMLVAQVVHLLIVKPVAAKVASSVRRATRALVELAAGLVAAPMTKPHYVIAADGHAAGRALVIGLAETVHVTGTAHVQLGPASISGFGTVTNPPA